MNNKKVSTKKGRAVKAARAKEVTLEERAEAIIGDIEHHKIDARVRVELALINYRDSRDGALTKYGYPADAAETVARYERELRELCDRAEAGDPLIREEIELGMVSEDELEAARKVLGLMWADGVPDFITDAIYVALRVAEDATGAELYVRPKSDWHSDKGEFSLLRVARFFKLHPSSPFKLEREHDLADHIAAILQDEGTPTALYNSMMDVLGQMTAARAVENNSTVIRVALDVHKREGEGASQ